jgi:hypothetical protein
LFSLYLQFQILHLYSGLIQNLPIHLLKEITAIAKTEIRHVEKDEDMTAEIEFKTLLYLR